MDITQSLKEAGMITYQDLEQLRDKDVSDEEIMEFVKSTIFFHKSTPEYKEAVIAEEYDAHHNRTIIEYQKLLYTVEGVAVPDNWGANFKMGRGFFPFFVVQENQFLLGNGVSWNNDSTEDKLGTEDDPD